MIESLPPPSTLFPILLFVIFLRRILRLFLSDCDLRTYTARLDPSHFRGKVCWITGASSGIGAALSKRLAREGALLILSSRRASVLNELADILPCPRGNAHVLPLDLTDLPEVEKAAAQVADIFGRLDFVFNNAGVSTRASAAELDMQQVQKVNTTDFLAPVALSRACLPALRAAPGGGGTIVNTASIAALIHTPLRSSYCAAKAALVAYFECLRLEEKDINVVNAYPGSVKTPIAFHAIGKGGKPFGRSDPNIEAGLEPDRVVDRMLAAVATGLPSCWIANRKEMMAVRVAQAFPRIWEWIAKGRAEAYQKSIENA